MGRETLHGCSKSDRNSMFSKWSTYIGTSGMNSVWWWKTHYKKEKTRSSKLSQGTCHVFLTITWRLFLKSTSRCASWSTGSDPYPVSSGSRAWAIVTLLPNSTLKMICSSRWSRWSKDPWSTSSRAPAQKRNSSILPLCRLMARRIHSRWRNNPSLKLA